MIKLRVEKLEAKTGNNKPELSPYLKKLLSEMEGVETRPCKCGSYLKSLQCSVYDVCISAK